MGEEGYNNNVDMAYPGRDGIGAVQERNAAQSTHGHGYTYREDIESSANLEKFT